MLMGLAVNWLAAALLALTIAFYVFVYTMWLKRRTPQNIVIGGAAGAFPPMVGWAAVTGEVASASIALFVLIFLWTPPHFWALALYRTERLRRGRRADAAGGGRCARHRRRRCWSTRCCCSRWRWRPGRSASPAPSTAAAARVLGLLFILAAARWRDRQRARMRHPAFRSIVYLFLLFVPGGRPVARPCRRARPTAGGLTIASRGAASGARTARCCWSWSAGGAVLPRSRSCGWAAAEGAWPDRNSPPALIAAVLASLFVVAGMVGPDRRLGAALPPVLPGDRLSAARPAGRRRSAGRGAAATDHGPLQRQRRHHAALGVRAGAAGGDGARSARA